MTKTQTQTVYDQVLSVVRQAQPGQETEAMRAILRLSAKWCSTLVGNAVVARDGAVVQGGLFAGMRYAERVAEGSLAPRLLGTYEAELQPHLRSFIDGGLDAVLDIGCAEGYYAVGMARLLPGATIHAHDTDPNARAMCADLASANDVLDRLRIGGEFDGSGFEAFADQRSLVIVDIEGAEASLLNPVAWPALAGLPLVVEAHPGKVDGVVALLSDRFSNTHQIEIVRCSPKAASLPPWLDEASELDRLLALYEWRTEPTPWMIMRPN